MKTKLTLLLLILCISSSAYANATHVDYNISWTGSNDYTLEGMFSFEDSLLGTGAITASSLNSFNIEGFQNGASMGTWDFFADGLASGFNFNFNFDTTTESF